MREAGMGLCVRRTPLASRLKVAEGEEQTGKEEEGVRWAGGQGRDQKREQRKALWAGRNRRAWVSS
jgi:hypothetical protein